MPKITTKQATKLRRCRSRDTQSHFPIALDSLAKLYPVSVHEEEMEPIQTRKVSFDGSSLYLVSKQKSCGTCLKRTRPCLLSIVSSDSHSLDESSTSKASLSSSSLSSSSLLHDVVNDSACDDSDTCYEYGQFVDVVPPDDSSTHSIGYPYFPRTMRSSLNLAFSPYPLARASRRHAIISRQYERKFSFDRKYRNKKSKIDTAGQVYHNDLNGESCIHRLKFIGNEASDSQYGEIKLCADALDHMRIQ